MGAKHHQGKKQLVGRGLLSAQSDPFGLQSKSSTRESRELRLFAKRRNEEATPLGKTGKKQPLWVFAPLSPYSFREERRVEGKEAHFFPERTSSFAKKVKPVKAAQKKLAFFFFYGIIFIPGINDEACLSLII
jgi:hypothetical protein